MMRSMVHGNEGGGGSRSGASEGFYLVPSIVPDEVGVVRNDTEELYERRKAAESLLHTAERIVESALNGDTRFLANEEELPPIIQRFSGELRKTEWGFVILGLGDAFRFFSLSCDRYPHATHVDLGEGWSECMEKLAEVLRRDSGRYYYDEDYKKTVDIIAAEALDLIGLDSVITFPVIRELVESYGGRLDPGFIYEVIEQTDWSNLIKSGLSVDEVYNLWYRAANSMTNHIRWGTWTRESHLVSPVNEENYRHGHVFNSFVDSSFKAAYAFAKAGSLDKTMSVVNSAYNFVRNMMNHLNVDDEEKGQVTAHFAHETAGLIGEFPPFGSRMVTEDLYLFTNIMWGVESFSDLEKFSAVATGMLESGGKVSDVMSVVREVSSKALSIAIQRKRDGSSVDYSADLERAREFLAAELDTYTELIERGLINEDLSYSLRHYMHEYVVPDLCANVREQRENLTQPVDYSPLPQSFSRFLEACKKSEDLRWFSGHVRSLLEDAQESLDVGLIVGGDEG